MRHLAALAYGVGDLKCYTRSDDLSLPGHFVDGFSERVKEKEREREREGEKDRVFDQGSEPKLSNAWLPPPEATCLIGNPFKGLVTRDEN